MVRIRIEDNGALKKGTLCVKGNPFDGGTPEFEFDVSLTDSEKLFTLCGSRILKKRRYLVQHEQHLFEIDEFLGDLSPLIIIEVELGSENQKINLPYWVGLEVTNNCRYTNASLVEHGIP